jgi:hypothetical protein
MMRQAKVIVRAEIDVSDPIDLHVRRVQGHDDLPLTQQRLLAPPRQKVRTVLEPVLGHGLMRSGSWMDRTRPPQVATPR